MLRRMLPPLAVLLSLSLSPTNAHALFGTPGPGDRLLQPPSQYFLPMEAGALDNHIDLQLLYTIYTVTIPGLGDDKKNVVQMGVDGQLALFDRFQVGLNIPFLSYNGFEVGAFSRENVSFGNMLLRLKYKLLGSSSGPFALSVFLNTLLPTASGIPTHDFAALQPGVAMSLGISRFTINADLSFWDSFTSDTNNVSAVMLDVHAALKILFLAPYLGFQLGEPFAGSLPSQPDWGKNPAIAMSAGVQFFPLSFLHIDLGTRIAFNDNGKRFYGSLGRATLVFGAGLRF